MKYGVENIYLFMSSLKNGTTMASRAYGFY
jgi:hypothetical protein